MPSTLCIHVKISFDTLQCHCQPSFKCHLRFTIYLHNDKSKTTASHIELLIHIHRHDVQSTSKAAPDVTSTSSAVVELEPGDMSGYGSVHSRNNNIRNENQGSAGSLAGSKRFFSSFHLFCLTRAWTNEPAASISTRRDWCSRFATRFSTKKVESMSQTRTNLSKTWSQTRFLTRFGAVVLCVSGSWRTFAQV